ncbi:MAG TPA: flavin reductase [Bacteroidales bacterium]|nr:flavin reductase [Bacteroidales bacterium]
MVENFIQIKPENIEDNIFKLIGTDWMLVCAGAPNNFNMMTASWGCAGVLWRKPVVVSFIRPQRHTFAYLENNGWFTLNFFDDEMRDVLNLCGTVSGRDMNKMEIEDITPFETDRGNVAFAEAKLILECRKLYYDDIKPEFFQVFEIEMIYPAKDYHRLYIGEIAGVLKKRKYDSFGAF